MSDSSHARLFWNNPRAIPVALLSSLVLRQELPIFIYVFMYDVHVVECQSSIKTTNNAYTPSSTLRTMQQNPVSGSKAPVDSRCLANKIAVGCVQILIHKLMVWNARARERQHPTKTFTCSIVHSSTPEKKPPIDMTMPCAVPYTADYSNQSWVGGKAPKYLMKLRVVSINGSSSAARGNQTVRSKA